MSHRDEGVATTLSTVGLAITRYMYVSINYFGFTKLHSMQ